MSASPVKVQGGLLVSSATGLTVGMHRPPQAVAKLPAPPNRNSCQLPSTGIGVADADVTERVHAVRPARAKNRIVLGFVFICPPSTDRVPRPKESSAPTTEALRMEQAGCHWTLDPFFPCNGHNSREKRTDSFERLPCSVSKGFTQITPIPKYCLSLVP